ncbi:ubiquinone biosynthesis hydrox [Collybia nuda]|uniref:Ubiquinone biosynthesis monooxygenase COQ6, mitochondrial n=1 Tax=Collybia nuda TaxID=64659 RepID=A0A9P6CJI5_9AGAR|nr:ubiquinone biosynthesis hydrox [Collybia nuda]
MFAPTSSRVYYVTAKRYTTRLPVHRAISTYEEYDVAIIGGGPAGLALASALGSSQVIQKKLRVVLIDAGDLSKVRNWSPPPGTFSNRVVSLTNSSQTFLREIGAWDHVEASRTSPMEEMQVWDGVSDARLKFSATEIGLDVSEDGMARLTEILNLQRGLLRRLEGFSNIKICDKMKVQTITRDSEERGGWPMVHLESSQVLRARLLVGADGFNSPVRSYAGVPSFGWSYDRQGIVATMVHAPRGAFEGPNTTAYQRFLPTGPIAFLPLSPTISSLVWSNRPHIASALIGSGPDVLANMINAAFRLPEVSLRYLFNRIVEAYSKGNPLSGSEIQREIFWREQSHSVDPNSAFASAMVKTREGVPPVDSQFVPPLVSMIQAGSVASFPLKFNHAESYIGEGIGGRTVLVGDAAHTVHPLAGQGLNMGIGDVESLTRCIHNALIQGGDVGSYTALQPYARERYLANHSLMAAVDKLHKLYTTTSEPVVWARSVGIEILNELDSVKAAIMTVAGAQNSKIHSDMTGWNFAAKGVESFVATAQVAKTLSGGLSGIIDTGLHNLLGRR